MAEALRRCSGNPDSRTNAGMLERDLIFTRTRTIFVSRAPFPMFSCPNSGGEGVAVWRETLITCLTMFVSFRIAVISLGILKERPYAAVSLVESGPADTNEPLTGTPNVSLGGGDLPIETGSYGTPL